MEITNIQDLKIEDCFLQVNFRQGYKYIDRAGEILNKFHKNGAEPAYRFNRQQMELSPPESPNKQIRVSVKNFWSHYKDPGSLDLPKDNFKNDWERISKTIDVEDKIIRVGWRTYFAYEIADNNELKLLTEKYLSSDEDVEMSSFTFEGEIEDYNLNMALRKVYSKETQEPALLLDVDLYEVFDNNAEDNLASYLTDMRNIFSGDSLTSLANGVMKTESNSTS